ncbi:MAG: oligosaccharide flippase family protein, partial [Candidatus Eisenbacteria bacterium]
LPAPLRALFARPVLANSVALIALRATNLGARLVLLFVLARLVLPAEFGLVVFALSLVEIAKVLSDFGMDTLAIREYALAQDGAQRATFAASLAAAKVMSGVGVYAALAGYFVLTRSRPQAELGLVLGLSILTALLTNFSLDYFQGRLRVLRVLPRVLWLNLALTLTAVLLLPRIPGLVTQVLCFPVIEAATGLALLLALRQEGLLGRPTFAFGEVAPLLRRSVPIAITAIVIMIYSRMDVLVLSSRLGETAVGYYGIAFRMTEPFQIAAAAFGLSVFSRFSAMFHAPKHAALGPLAARYVASTLGYGVATALALGLLAPPLVARWLPAYASATPILRILAGALVFRTLNATLAGILQGAGRFRLLTGFALWNLLLTYGLLVVLVPRFGGPGVAWAGLIGEGFNSLLQLALVARTIAARERTVAHVG